MRVTSITPNGRNGQTGEFDSGDVLFSDGKDWKFWFSRYDGSVQFLVDSGVPSQWSASNYGRMISPPKRQAAVIKYFEDHCRCCNNLIAECETAPARIT